MALVRLLSVFILSVSCLSPIGLAQNPSVASAPPSPLENILSMAEPGTGAWTGVQMDTMARLRDAAMMDAYAYDELAYLTDGIGPRLSGSPEAETAVERVAARMRALGAKVTLEKTQVPHWIRGEESAELTQWPGKVSKAPQKIIVTALGNSVATPSTGLTASVVVVRSFAELKALRADSVSGKIVLF